jgi:hypothetical protein
MLEAPTRIELTRSKWPDADRSAWASIVRSGDILDEAGAGAHWSQGTRTKYAQSYGFWLGFLKERGWLDAAADPPSRVTPEAVSVYIRDVSERCTIETVVMRMAEFLWVVRAMQPDGDWQWLENLLRRLRRRCRPSELKPAPAVSASDVYNAGLTAMRATSDAPELPDRERAIRFRDGLILSLLIARPLRLRTFLNIDIERNLVRETDGYLLVLAAEDIKTKRPAEYSAPTDLVSWIDRYINHYRPMLLGNKTSARLWITKDGNPMSVSGFTKRLVTITRDTFGVPFRAHAFRHIAATSITTEDPEHVRIIASILGHTSLEMADKHYNRARQIDAMTAHQRVIQSLRANRFGEQNAGRIGL